MRARNTAQRYYIFLTFPNFLRQKRIFSSQNWQKSIFGTDFDNTLCVCTKKSRILYGGCYWVKQAEKGIHRDLVRGAPYLLGDTLFGEDIFLILLTWWLYAHGRSFFCALIIKILYENDNVSLHLGESFCASTKNFSYCQVSQNKQLNRWFSTKRLFLLKHKVYFFDFFFEKKLQKSLHNWKIICNFAADFESADYGASFFTLITNILTKY